MRKPGPLLLVLLTLTLAALVIVHTRGFNGPWYWQWRWRSIPALRWYAAMMVAAMPAFLGLALAFRTTSSSPGGRGGEFFPIALLMVSSIALRLASAMFVRGDFDTSLTIDAVKSPEVTSYYNDAVRFAPQNDWLADYPRQLYYTFLHTQSKPPGPVWYWRTVIQSFGDGSRTMLLGAIGIALLSALSVPATRWVVCALTHNRQAAFLAAAWTALAPGMILFYPLLDPIYLVFTAAIVVFFYRAVQRKHVAFATAFGAALALAAFFSYLPLLLVPWLVVLGLLCCGHRPAVAVPIIFRAALVALAAFVGFYVLLGLLSGFNPVATFFQAWKNQQLFLQRHAPDRHYPLTIPFDLLDFLLGAGWISLPLIFISLFRRDEKMRLKLSCIAVPIALALSGQVQTETARVWMFLLPLWALPIGLELSRWEKKSAVIALGCLWLLTAVIGQNMLMISP